MKSVLSNYICRLTIIAIAILSTLANVSCSNNEDNTIEKRAKDFAQNYFNFRYEAAMNMCTEESKKWIVFHASNISQDDINAINSQTDTASCEVEDIDVNEIDGIASVKLIVKNAFMADSIGKNGEIASSTEKELRMKMISGIWYVDLNKPL